MKYIEELDRVSYSVGLSIASNLMSSGLSTINIEAFTEALTAAYAGQTPAISTEEANTIIQAYFEKAQAAQGDVAKTKGEAFLAENKTKDGVVTLESGLQYKIVTEGTGTKPKATDTVSCHYEGTLIDGSIFDSSVKRGQPAEFPVNGVIQGWVEALQLMPVGSKWQLFIPSELAYGARGAGQSIGPNETLIFEVELLKIV